MELKMWEIADGFLREDASKVEKITKGGPGSGCQGPNCGRPRTGTHNLEYRTKFKNSFSFNAKDPVKTIENSTGKPVDKFVVTKENEFVPVHSSEAHGVAIRDNNLGSFDSTTRVVQDLKRKVAFIRAGYPDAQILNSAIIDGDERAMNTILAHQREIAGRLYDKHPGMKVILASGGTWRTHNNNLPRDIDSGADLPDKPESFVDSKFIYKT